MTDKIKLKADEFVNDKKFKLNYLKPKDLKILLAEFCEEQIAELKAECDLAIEGRDVKIAELEHQLTHRNCVDCSNHSSKLKMKVLELEKENKTVSRKANEAIADKLLITAKYNEVLNDLNQENGKLQKENAELKKKCYKKAVKDYCEFEKENERLKGDLELWENGACRATNLDKCGVVKELEAQIEKMKWHNLKKNPNDLPNNKRSVWCYYGDGCGKGFYDKDDGGWWIEGHIYCSVINAWKELPEVPKED